MTTRQTIIHTAPYAASSTGTRAGFTGLAAMATFAVLTSLGHLADRQVEEVLMAQTGQAAVAQASAPDHGA